MVRRRSCRLLAALAVLVLLPLASLDVRAHQDGSLKSILVTPLDKSGKALTGLTAADFTVKENNEARQVTKAVPSADLLYVALLIDTAQPAPGTIPPTQTVRKALGAFVKDLQAACPNAQVSFTEFGGAAVTTVPFTNFGDTLTQRIDHLYSSPQAGAVMLEALVSTANSLANVPTPRRAIVAVSLGAPETSAMQPNDVVGPVEQSGASIWWVSVSGMGTTSSGAVQSMSDNNTPMRDAVMSSLTKGTGGERLSSVSASALPGLLEKVSAALTGQYIVTYIRPDGAHVTSIEPDAKGAKKVLMAPIVR
jgi:hypothetical protein